MVDQHAKKSKESPLVQMLQAWCLLGTRLLAIYVLFLCTIINMQTGLQLS